MSVPELAHRVRERALRATARGRLEGWDRYPPVPVSSPFAALIPGLSGAGPHLWARVIAAADLAQRGRFSTLGRDWPASRGADPYPSSVWTLDPVTGRHWPGSDLYCFDVPYRHERGLGDVKYVWELNRLQGLQPLAVAALISGDPGHLLAAERMLLSWTAANPPFRGLAWASGIEVALRAISLLVLSGLVGDRLGREARDAIGSVLTASALWLDRFPSRFSSANNHKVAEEAALYLICLALPETPERRRLLARAAAALDAEAALQLLPDGAPAEQSPTYGAFTAEFLLICDRLGRDGPCPLGPATRDRLARLSGFLLTLSGALGCCPRIGDDDGGRVLTFTLPEPDYALNVARLIRGAQDRPATELRDLLPAGPDPLAVPERSDGVISFPDGGYTLLRGRCAGREVAALLDHGPLGYLSIAAHGHADALSLLLSLDGRPVLIDPGTYLYHSGGAWRDWFRSSRAHNTLTLEGADQSRMSGAFNWSSRARARRVEAGAEPPFVIARQDGYLRRFGAEHERELLLTGAELLVRDRLIGDGARRGLAGELTFQLAPDLDAALTGDRAVLIRDRDGGAPIARLLPPPGGEVRLHRGGTDRDGGWVSPRFGERVPATRISWRGPIGPDPIETRVIPC